MTCLINNDVTECPFTLHIIFFFLNVPPLCPDFLLLIDGSGRVLPIRTSGNVSLGVASKSPEGSGSVSALTSDFQKFSPFAAPLEDGGDKQTTGDESAYLPPHMRVPPPAASQRGGANGGVQLDYSPYYAATDYYSSLAKEHSLESQDSSTLSSPSDCLAQAASTGTGAAGSGAAGQDSLFQFSIGKILDDETGAPIPAGAASGPDCELPGFYEGVAYTEGPEGEMGPTSPLQLRPTDRPDAQRSSADAQVKR